MLCEADLVSAGPALPPWPEVCAAGKPSIIVPSPYVADNHQEKNARVLERYGAAVVITEAEATGKKIYDTACQLLQDPAKLQEMGAKARSLAKTDAVEQIYQGICQLLA